MTFWQIFFNVAQSRPRQALAALWWHLTRRRVRAKNVLKMAAADLPFLYRWWMQGKEAASIAALDDRTGLSTTISVAILPSDADQQAFERSLTSVQRQVLQPRQIIVSSARTTRGLAHPAIVELAETQPDEAAFLASAFAAVGEGFLVPLRAGDELSPSALLFLERALHDRPDIAFAYGDHDHRGESGDRCQPWFKPDWDVEQFLAQDFASPACAIAVVAGRDALAAASAPRSLFELLLKLSAKPDVEIAHLPHILLHRQTGEQTTSSVERIAAIGRQLRLRATEGPYGTVRVERPLPDPPPLVTIIVPTRDKLELIQPCLRSLLDRTTYKPFEIVVVDNGSTDPRTLAFLRDVAADARVRIVSAPIPYNYSALNNLAVAQARGDYVCLLNNDTEVVEGEWLTDMMRHAVRPEVGAVGAKLLYPDRTLQHAGVVVGMGDAAGHIHRFARDDEPGYFAQPHLTRGVTAVTAACLLVAKQKYLEVGGLDEQDLAIAYNDIDLCLKLRAKGWRNIYVASAVLIHHESKSRVRDHAPSQVERYSRELLAFQRRWGIGDFVDPLFNPNLDPSSEYVVIRVD